jgi:hypothetical protein
MRLMILTAAAVSLGAIDAAAEGFYPCLLATPAGVAGPTVSLSDPAEEPLASLVIAETITLVPPASVAQPGAAPNAAPSYIGPGPTVVTPTRGQDTALPSDVPNTYAAVDAGPTFPPPSSTFLLHRPGYDAPLGR